MHKARESWRKLQKFRKTGEHAGDSCGAGHGGNVGDRCGAGHGGNVGESCGAGHVGTRWGTLPGGTRWIALGSAAGKLGTS